MKKALICGVSGQDEAYLARFLLTKGYEVWGTSRDATGSSFINLHRLGIADQVSTIPMVPEDFRTVYLAIARSEPCEVYYLGKLCTTPTHPKSIRQYRHETTKP